MPDVRIFHYANCSSCRKAVAALESSTLTVEQREMFRDRLSTEEIRSILAELGKSAHDVLSTRSTPYRELGLAEKSLTEDEVIDLMAQHPALIRRPIVLGPNGGQVGYGAKALGEMIAGIERGKNQ